MAQMNNNNNNNNGNGLKYIKNHEFIMILKTKQNETLTGQLWQMLGNQFIILKIRE